MAIMAPLHLRLTQWLGGDREHAFYTHSLRLLTNISRNQVDMNDWTITSFDVKFLRLIGHGGLYVISDIASTTYQLTHTFVSEKPYDRRWNRMQVATKVLTSADAVPEHSEVGLHIRSAGENITADVVMQSIRRGNSASPSQCQNQINVVTLQSRFG